LVPDLRAAAGDDLEHVIGKAGSLQNLCKPDRGKWRLAMRFQNHGIAGSDGRSNLVCDEVQRVVKGRNRHNHAHRLVDEVSRTPFTARTLRERYGLCTGIALASPRASKAESSASSTSAAFARGTLPMKAPFSGLRISIRARRGTQAPASNMS